MDKSEVSIRFGSPTGRSFSPLDRGWLKPRPCSSPPRAYRRLTLNLHVSLTTRVDFDGHQSIRAGAHRACRFLFRSAHDEQSKITEEPANSSHGEFTIWTTKVNLSKVIRELEAKHIVSATRGKIVWETTQFLIWSSSSQQLQRQIAEHQYERLSFERMARSCWASSQTINKKKKILLREH